MSGQDSPGGLHEPPVGQGPHHDRFSEPGPGRRGRGRSNYARRGDSWGPRGRMQGDGRPHFMGHRGGFQGMPHPGRGGWQGEENRMGRFPFHGEQPNGPPFPHHPEDMGGLPPMPDMPQGPMMGDRGPMLPHFGQMGPPPPFQGGRGRGFGRGGPGDGPRRGHLPLDPAMLERRRQSTAAIVQRQLQNVQVSESVAGQKAYAHYQRAASNEDGEAVGPAPSKGLWDEDPIKRLPMYQAVAAEETAFPVGRSQDPRDPFDIALEEYQAVPDSNLTMHQSKHGSFLGPSHMTPAVL